MTEWSLYCPGHNVGSVKLGVFRRQAGTNYRCIGLNEVDTSFEGKRTIPVDPANQIEFKAGDYIGVYWKNDRSQICCSGCASSVSPPPSFVCARALTRTSIRAPPLPLPR